MINIEACVDREPWCDGCRGWINGDMWLIESAIVQFCICSRCLRRLYGLTAEIVRSRNVR